MKYDIEPNTGFDNEAPELTVGDTVKIVSLECRDCPDIPPLADVVGQVTEACTNGTFRGTWGEQPLLPSVDAFIIISRPRRELTVPDIPIPDPEPELIYEW